MEYINEFIKPELLILIPVVYCIGIGMKKTEKISNNFIPLLLGATGVVLATLWVIATSELNNYREVVMALFTAITQGVLVSAGSVYVDQLIKQTTKKES